MNDDSSNFPHEVPPPSYENKIWQPKKEQKTPPPPAFRDENLPPPYAIPYNFGDSWHAPPPVIDWHLRQPAGPPPPIIDWHPQGPPPIIMSRRRWGRIMLILLVTLMLLSGIMLVLFTIFH